LNPLRERDLGENHHHSKPNFSCLPSKPDISTWQRLGHFYLALTYSADEVAGRFPVLRVRGKGDTLRDELIGVVRSTPRCAIKLSIDSNGTQSAPSTAFF
jgi:hypothetical protein